MGERPVRPDPRQSQRSGVRHEDPDALHRQGLMALEAGRHRDAALLLARAIVLCPDNAVYLYDRSVVSMALRRFADSAASCGRAVAIAPATAAAHFNRGNALHAMRQFAA